MISDREGQKLQLVDRSRLEWTTFVLVSAASDQYLVVYRSRKFFYQTNDFSFKETLPLSPVLHF